MSNLVGLIRFRLRNTSRLSDAAQSDVQAAPEDLLAMLPPPQSGYSAISQGNCRAATTVPSGQFHLDPSCHVESSLPNALLPS